MKLLHYSSDEISSLEHREYSQSELNWQAKPNGLWFSVEYGEDKGNWKEWCEAENYLIKNLSIVYEITLDESKNILYLKTSEEIFEFSKQYRLKTRGWDEEWDTYQINWSDIKSKYQGIIISPYQWDCRLSLESCWYYGWDCSSGCIWDLSCVKEFKRCAG